MRVVRWVVLQVLIFPASVLFVLAAVGLFLLSLVEPTLRIAMLRLKGQPVSERQLWRVRNIPRSALRFVGFALRTVPLAHSVRIGET